MFSSLIDKLGRAFKHAIDIGRRTASEIFRTVQHLPRAEQGKLENRYHYSRPLGGFRLRPTGKHHRGHAPYHGKPGSKYGAIHTGNRYVPSH